MTVGGSFATKPARLVGPGEPIVIVGPPARFVSRGGEKLEAAIDRFGIEASGIRAADVGASTGGFTDCLLQRGAAEVVAIDVGRGQLHERIRSDRRVSVHEGFNARELEPTRIGGAAELVVVDVSFISLRTILDAVLAVTRPAGAVVPLVKPQFEAGRREADRGRGVIRDPVVWRRVLDEVIDAFVEREASIMGVMLSPLLGATGNREFFLHGRGPDGTPPRPLPDG